MLKSFYNHYRMPRGEKFFFDRNVAVRSTAYGDRVAAEFALWQKYYADSKESKNFLLCEQGDVNGNPVRNGSFYGRIGKCALPRLVSGEILRPLLLGDLLFEVRSDGYVLLNGKRVFCAGSEIKGWAIAALLEEERDVLFVIAKPVGSRETMLRGYAIADGAVSGEPIVSTVLPTVLDGHSEIVCYGKHIFVSHGGSLLYYYFTGGTLEYVPIGAATRNDGKPQCTRVGKLFAADSAHVFWTADEDVYYLTVGRPNLAVRLPAEQGGKTVRLTVFDDALYAVRRVGDRSVCYRYTDFDDMGAKKSVFSDGVGSVLLLASEGDAVRCVAVSASGRRAEDAILDRDKRVNSVVPVETERVFCFGNDLYENAIYVGLRDGSPIGIGQ